METVMKIVTLRARLMRSSWVGADLFKYESMFKAINSPSVKRWSDGNMLLHFFIGRIIPFN